MFHICFYNRGDEKLSRYSIYPHPLGAEHSIKLSDCGRDR